MREKKRRDRKAKWYLEHHIKQLEKKINSESGN